MNFPVSRQAAAVSLALALISSTAIAEVADTVVVTATRTPQLAADLIADTTVINAEEIAFIESIVRPMEIGSDLFGELSADVDDDD